MLHASRSNVKRIDLTPLPLLLSPSFAFASGIKAGLLDVILGPASHILENYIRDVRHDGAMSDPKFLRLGVCRVLSQAASGRDFLQMLRDTMDESVARVLLILG